MNRPPINAKRVLIAVTALLLISSQLPVGAATAIAYVPRSFVALITKPAALLHRMATTMRAPRQQTPDFGAGGDLADQLAQARVYIDNLEQEVLELRNVSESLAQIDALLDIEDIRLAGASVLGFNGDIENPILTLGVGSDAGVRDGLAVVWGANLVGKVVSTSAMTADVQLITTAGTKLQVRITPPTVDPSAVTLPAYVELAEDGRSFYTDEFALDASVQVGDLVLLADDSWQFRARGFLVGVVTEAIPHPDRPYLNKHVVIRPMLSLASLPRVVVLVPRD